MSPLITWLGGRKFFLTVGCGIACTVLRGIDRLDDATFGLVILGTVGAYITGNVFQKKQAPDVAVDP